MQHAARALRHGHCALGCFPWLLSFALAAANCLCAQVVACYAGKGRLGKPNGSTQWCASESGLQVHGVSAAFTQSADEGCLHCSLGLRATHPVMHSSTALATYSAPASAHFLASHPVPASHSLCACCPAGWMAGCGYTTVATSASAGCSTLWKRCFRTQQPMMTRTLLHRQRCLKPCW